MVMESLVFGLKNTEIMDAKMSEILPNNKKTRRGKKNRQRKFLLPGNKSDVFSTILENEENCKLKINRSRRGLKIRGVRPCSPKAPMNSTQFLMEDKFDREIESRNEEIQNFPSMSSLIDEETVFHRLSMSPTDEDYSSFDFYDENNEEKRTEIDFQYEPISVEDTVNFIGEDFEKVFSFHNISDNKVKTESRVQEISKLSKFEIIHKMLKMECQLSRSNNDHTDSNSDDFKTKIVQLQEENARLKSENFALKNMFNN